MSKFIVRRVNYITMQNRLTWSSNIALHSTVYSLHPQSTFHSKTCKYYELRRTSKTTARHQFWFYKFCLWIKVTEVRSMCSHKLYLLQFNQNLALKSFLLLFDLTFLPNFDFVNEFTVNNKILKAFDEIFR